MFKGKIIDFPAASVCTVGISYSLLMMVLLIKMSLVLILIKIVYKYRSLKLLLQQIEENYVQDA